MSTDFTKTKTMLTNATVLHFPSTEAPITLTTDASDKAVGAVLEQRIDGVGQPLAFFSRQLQNAEQKYSAFGRELLAIYLSIRHFRYYHEGRNFTMAKTSEPWYAQQQRHPSYISEFPTDIRHIAGTDNLVADALSRININSLLSGVDYVAVAAAQQDAELKSLRISPKTNLKPADVAFGNTTLLCDVSTNQARPIVPASCKRQIFDMVHSLAHPGVKTTQRLVANKFVWHGLKKQVGTWAKQCTACQQSKIQRHVRAPLQTFEVPSRRFQHINIDIVGPLPSSKGFTHLLTIVDRFTRWPEAIPLNDISTTSCARALIAHWISRFGLPKDMSSDRGAQFTSQLWSTTADFYGIKLHRTTAYHPQANGLVERFHRHLKSALRARLEGPNWIDALPWVLLGIRTAPK